MTGITLLNMDLLTPFDFNALFAEKKELLDKTTEENEKNNECKQYVIAKRYIDLDDVPGFGKLTGLIMMISVILILLWVLQKTRIIVFSYLPFYYVLLIVIGLIFIFRFGMRRIFK